MSFYSNVTEQDSINLSKLAEKQKNQRVLKINKRILKQTQDIKIAENLSPSTKNLEEVNECFIKLGGILKESNSAIEIDQAIVPFEIDTEEYYIETKKKALPNGIYFSIPMMKTLRALMNSRRSLKLPQDNLGKFSILGITNYTLGGDRRRINDNIFVLTPEIIKMFSTSYLGETVKKVSDVLTMDNNLNNLGYTGDKSSNSKTLLITFT